MEGLKKIQSCVETILKVVGCILTLSVPVIMLVQVVLRYVFKAPLLGVEELLQFPTVWMYMLGAVMASMTRTHIECGMLAVYVKNQKVLSIVAIFKNIVTVVVSLWLTRWCGWYALYSLDKGKVSGLLHIPQFVGDVSLVFGLVFMTIYAIVDLILCFKQTRDLFKSDDSGEVAL